MDRRSKGIAGEEFAIALYKRAGFEILETNLRVGRAQIDFCAQRQECIHFVEVKYRKTLFLGHQSLTQSQLERIASAAQIYMRARPNLNWQTDIMLIDEKAHWQRIDNIRYQMHSS